MADGIGDMELFRAVVAAGGISAGALALGSSPPAVSRRLAALEARLGVRLAERSARRFRLTDEGALYYERCRTILGELRDAEAEVSARGATARGLLKVGAPMELGRRWIAPLLAAFAEAHPALEAHLVLSDAGLEVGQDGLDVALRVDRPDDPSVIARRIATTRRLVCAAPSYLAARGMPEQPCEHLTHLGHRDRGCFPPQLAVAPGTRTIVVRATMSYDDASQPSSGPRSDRVPPRHCRPQILPRSDAVDVARG